MICFHATRRQQSRPQQLLACVLFLLQGCATLQPHAVDLESKISAVAQTQLEATNTAAANLLLGLGNEQNSSEQRVDAKLEHIKGKVDASTNNSVTNVDVWTMRAVVVIGGVYLVGKAYLRSQRNRPARQTNASN